MLRYDKLSECFEVVPMANKPESQYKIPYSEFICDVREMINNKVINIFDLMNPKIFDKVKAKMLDLNKISNNELYKASREILENSMNNLFKWQGVDNKTGELMYQSYQLGRQHEIEIRNFLKENK